MIRLHFVVEGQTEFTFVRELLVDHLIGYDIIVDQREVEFSRTQNVIYRGGLIDYGKLKRDVQRWMSQDQNTDARFTTMIDLYALPENFPEFSQAKKIIDPYQRVEFLETAFQNDIADRRFIPYIQLHEFEALLFAEPTMFEREFAEYTSEIQRLSKIMNQFNNNPELINDGKTTAPSKRIIALIPEYKGRKSSAGPGIAAHIGLQTLRSCCSHFDQWISKLEQLT